MTDSPTKKPVRDTLRDNLAKSNEKFLGKDTARNAAEKAVYAHVSKWAGTTIEPGAPIPILQDTSIHSQHCMKELRGTSLTGPPAIVRELLNAANLLKRKELEDKLQELEQLKACFEETLKVFARVDPAILLRAEALGKCSRDDLHRRIVLALRPTDAACTGLEILADGLESEIGETSLELVRHGKPRLGAQKDKAAYEVAYQAAKLFAVVLGEKPTYSEQHTGKDKNGKANPNVHYGRYTPFLRDLFNALGWEKRSLRAPANEAIAGLIDSDFIPPRIPRMHPFNSVPKS